MSRDIVRALTVDRGHLYMHSPYFKTAIDTLATMLPLWVEGIAAQATEQDRQYHRAMESIRLDMQPRVFVDLTKDARRDMGFPGVRDL
ncbi:hypothetical protein [Terracoccus sp. 273MFTsu3.1]|uniref:hypothetical protein n=1 Tax=Terracoccus sp. 273MFTsu3.1 TaxID=1172188 RepID=UPI0003689F68|nr:hypothetical protein [Terracoccus sp. 273MFTsu3.1]